MNKPEIVNAVKVIFDCAAEIESPEERVRYLEQACADNPDLRGRVEALLKAYEQAGSFLESPPVEVQQTLENPPITERPGTVIGRYKLLQQIGEGGFGVVFMAEQLEPVRRQVAVKVIKPGMDTKEVVARFEAERQALAMMDHPNIARVLDGGATESGRPYFVMELVHGVPIIEYCDKANLPMRERLRLFISVCQAVQHAHQKGIIHRDIKPKNVLVTLHDGTPVVKVIDFGISKAIGQKLTERTLFTSFGQMVGTPIYMSPEQAEMSGLGVDTRTDIYSLGVLLYELLTGETPFDRERLSTAAYDEIRRIIREEEPPKPSTRVSTMGQKATVGADNRKTDPKKLSALLQGDLDWIVMKSLEKDRTRRYETAKDFADDVQHYLTDEPVEARAPSTWYRLRKLLRRYRAAAATIAAVGTVLVAATAFSTWMAVREVRAQEEMRLALLKAEQLRQVAEETSRKERNAAEEAKAAFEMIGATFGADEGQRLLPHDPTVSETLQRLEKRLEGSPDMNYRVKASVGIVIAKAYMRVGKSDSAQVRLRRVAETMPIGQGEVDGKASESLLRQLADTSVDLANAAKGKGMSDVAEGAYRNALVFCEQIGRLDPANTWCRGQVAYCHYLLGEVLERSGQNAKAEQAYRRAVELHEPLTKELPNAADYRTRLEWSYQSLARTLQVRGGSDDAERAFAGSIAFWEKAGADDSVAPLHRRQVGYLQRVLGEVLENCGEAGKAEQLYRRAVEVHESLVARSPRDTDLSERLVSSYWSLGQLLYSLGRSDDAKKLYATPTTRVRKALAECDLTDVDGQVVRWNQLGGLLAAQGEFFDGKDALCRAVTLSEHLGAARKSQTTENLAFLLSTLRDWQGVETIARDWLRPASGKPRPELYQLVGMHYYALAVTLEMQDKSSDCQAIWREMLAVVEQARSDGRTVYPGGCANAIIYAQILARTHNDKATLQHALRLLKEVEIEANWGCPRSHSRYWWHGVCGDVHRRLGEKEEALRHYRVSAENADYGFFCGRHYAERLLTRFLCDAGRFPEAEKVVRNAIADCKKYFGENHVLGNYARTDLAELLIERKKFDEVEPLLQQAQKGLLAEPRVPASERRRVCAALAKLYESTGKADQAAAWRAKRDAIVPAGPAAAAVNPAAAAGTAPGKSAAAGAAPGKSTPKPVAPAAKAPAGK